MWCTAPSQSAATAVSHRGHQHHPRHHTNHVDFPTGGEVDVATYNAVNNQQPE
ncbi:hypothetical protein [Hymenobacter negativus]|uniref:Uncharacterized protein n=1 Tax=Hymenobacter negativus TaxID=2795026 RepID=A0ABS3QHV5_9BACT|nr:hypothetical protein [Hymenobacter negativus]MBO2010812.1 hypothetical protein [Hymenobacter negativus]